MTYRFRIGWMLTGFLTGFMVGLLLMKAAGAAEPHSWHTWVLDHYEWVYDANDERVKRCVFVCTTDVNNPHYEMSLGNEHGCIVP